MSPRMWFMISGLLGVVAGYGVLVWRLTTWASFTWTAWLATFGTVAWLVVGGVAVTFIGDEWEWLDHLCEARMRRQYREHLDAGGDLDSFVAERNAQSPLRKMLR